MRAIIKEIYTKDVKHCISCEISMRYDREFQIGKFYTDSIGKIYTSGNKFATQ